MNSNEMKLREEKTRKSILLSSGSFILNIPEEVESTFKPLSSSTSLRNKDKSMLIDEVNRIKK
jgi:hypothetical protein